MDQSVRAVRWGRAWQENVHVACRRRLVRSLWLFFAEDDILDLGDGGDPP